MTRRLIIISGPDRIGKSTVVSELERILGDDIETVHLAEPPKDQEDPYDINRDKTAEWVAGRKNWCVFDRSYPCSFVLEDFRRRNHGHLDEIVQMELDMLSSRETFRVCHVLLRRPWSWSAPHHLDEVRALHPTAAEWFIRDEYVARMREHKLYYQRMDEFLEHFTAFPRTSHTLGVDPQSDARSIISKVTAVLP